MATTVANMTKKEFTEILSTIVEEKLYELLGDPEDGLILKENIRRRLLRQKESVAAGERGEEINRVITRLDIK